MSKWPKQLPPLTAEQQAISADFMNAHLLALQTKWYKIVENFNHKYPLRSFRPGCRTLEIGAGIGAHLKYETFGGGGGGYYCNELLPNLCRILEKEFPEINVIEGDCQRGFPQIEDGYFDRILAIHVLEHLPDLPACLHEVHRLLRPDGLFSIVIPCEGGLATRTARNISARPHFEKRYKQSYDWFIRSQHINMPYEIMEELKRHFIIVDNKYYPLLVPSINVNLSIGMTLKPIAGNG